MEKKESNPKMVYGDTKVGLSSLPFGPLYEVALAMLEGGLKYGKHNYRELGCKASTYFDAAIGHLIAWHEGEDIDEESGLPHLMKAVACLIVIRDSQLMGNDTDDRPIKYPKGVPLRNNPLVQKLKDKYPNPEEPYTELRKTQREIIKKTKLRPPLVKDRRVAIRPRRLVTYGRRSRRIRDFKPERRVSLSNRRTGLDDRRFQ